jgi:HSP20 family molecular chaperone IbpA
MSKKNGDLEVKAPETSLQNQETKPATKLSPVFVEAEKLFDRMAEITNEIGQRAFDFFRLRGGEFGKELDDWFRAEREILRPTPVEITEADNNIFVTAAVPGFKPEDIEVSVNGDTLILSGKTETKEKKENANTILNEWNSNQFFRQFTLPSQVDAGKVEAKLKDGMLELTLPKAAGTEAKKIAVSAG